MNKEKLLQQLKDPNTYSEEDIPFLEEFIDKYPYCQFAYVVLAKLSKEHNKPEKTLKLNQAALHSTNRAILKNIIEEGWHLLPKFQPVPVFDELNETERIKMTENSFNNQEKIEPTESINSIDPISDKEIQPEPQQDGLSTSSHVEPEYTDIANKIIEAIKENRKIREQFQKIDLQESNDLEEKEDEHNNDTVPNVITDQNDSSDEMSNKSDNDGDEDSSDKKKKQIEIIDNFINFESTLVKRKLKIPDGPSAPQEDLSLKSSSLNDDLVSENLALIMKKQGKIDKAIDIYKKLIWKFPQKKAYFASLIEELKNTK